MFSLKDHRSVTVYCIISKERTGLIEVLVIRSVHWWDRRRIVKNDYWVGTEGVIKSHWQLQSSRTPPAPIILAGGRAPNAFCLCNMALILRKSGWRALGWTCIWMNTNDLLLTIWLSKCPLDLFCLYRKKGLHCTSFCIHMGLFKIKETH